MSRPTPHSRDSAFLVRESMRLARADEELDREFDEIMEIRHGRRASDEPESPPVPRLKPVASATTRNLLRPRTLAEVVGQEALKPLLRQLIDSARAKARPLSHLLFVGGAGTGKTTLATVIANEIGTRTFQLEAPLDMLVLDELRQVARDRDIVFVDEVHKQVSGDRRGLSQACDPESFYALLEDGMLATPTGPVPFPRVTWIGATTDVGLMPQSLSDRFTIQPRLAAYTTSEMETIAQHNLQALWLTAEPGVAGMFAGASRGIPRLVNNYIRAAGDLIGTGQITKAIARQVVEVLNSTTLDGLTGSMQTVLTYLYQNGWRPTKDGGIYSASVNSLATACGHGRDTKAINLLVEPYLLQRGLIQVRPTGRVLTPAGIERARQLTGG